MKKVLFCCLACLLLVFSVQAEEVTLDNGYICYYENEATGYFLKLDSVRFVDDSEPFCSLTAHLFAKEYKKNVVVEKKVLFVYDRQAKMIYANEVWVGLHDFGNEKLLAELSPKDELITLPADNSLANLVYLMIYDRAFDTERYPDAAAVIDAIL